MILIVDDDEVSRNFIQKSLEEGYPVHSCHDGLIAFKYYAELIDEIDLVIINLATRQWLNGERCLPILKEVKPGTKVIVISTHDENESEEVKSFIKQGIPCLKKPICPLKLKETINSLLKN